MSAAGVVPGSGAGEAGPEAVQGSRQLDRGTVRHDAVHTGRWIVRGIAKVVGPADVGTADLAGTVVVGGRLTARALRSTGSLESRGPVAVTGRLATRGSFETGTTVEAAEARLHGAVRLGGDLSVSGVLTIRGSVRAPNVRCGQLALHGGAAVPGTVAADALEARFTRDSTLGAVTGRTVHLRGPAPNPVDLVLGKTLVVTVGRVEADSVELSAVRVGFVRAAEIRLGPNAHVAAVEGRIVRAHRSSHVGPESWSRPPPGLSR